MDATPRFFWFLQLRFWQGYVFVCSSVSRRKRSPALFFFLVRRDSKDNTGRAGGEFGSMRDSRVSKGA